MWSRVRHAHTVPPAESKTQQSHIPTPCRERALSLEGNKWSFRPLSRVPLELWHLDLSDTEGSLSGLRCHGRDKLKPFSTVKTHLKRPPGLIKRKLHIYPEPNPAQAEPTRASCLCSAFPSNK